MLYYIITAALVLHTVFWGMGLGWLILPRAWRRWWWALAPGLGLALQSAVVWAGAHTPLAGANSYALWSELLPLGLLAAAVARHGWPATRGLAAGRMGGARPGVADGTGRLGVALADGAARQLDTDLFLARQLRSR